MNDRNRNKAERFRKRPVLVQAIQYTGELDNLEAVVDWLRTYGCVVRQRGESLSIPTLEGRITASPGDWIIRGVWGEFYPCKPEIFEETYEPA